MYTASGEPDPAVLTGTAAVPGDSPDSLTRPEPDPASAWLPLLSSLLAALFAAWLFQPPPHPFSFLASLLDVFVWLTATACAGAGAMLLSRLCLTGTDAPAPQSSFDALAACILLPPLLVVSERNSVWTLAFTAAIAAACALSLYGRYGRQSSGQPSALPLYTGLFAGLPAPEPGRPQAFLIAAAFQGALAFLLGRHLLLAAFLMAIGSFLLGRRILTGPAAEPSLAAAETSLARASAAAMLAVIFLVPLVTVGRAGAWAGPGGRAHAPHKSSAVARNASGVVQDGYRGIILWPVAPKQKVLVTPPSENAAFGGRSTRALVIPFDGSYWYFQTPHHDPGANPHLAHGDPKAVSIYSASWIPVVMQAHQNLATPVDLTCCRRLRITVDNGDNRPGSLALGIVLRDSRRPGKPFVFLNPQTLPSTEQARFYFKAHPIADELTFPIPARPSIRAFDQITVIYFPSEARATLGARVSIRQFELLRH